MKTANHSTSVFNPIQPVPSTSTNNNLTWHETYVNLCEKCNKSFSLKRSLTNHKKVCGNKAIFKCTKCNKEYLQNINLIKHIKKCGFSTKVNCMKCKKEYANKSTLVKHLKKCCDMVCNRCRISFPTRLLLNIHKKKICEKKLDLRPMRSKKMRSLFPRDEQLGIVTIDSAFNGNLVTYYIENKYNSDNLDNFFTMVFEIIENKVEEHLQVWPGVAINFGIDAVYENPITHEKVERNFKSKNIQVYNNTVIEQIINDAMDKIACELEEYEGKGSGYTLLQIDGVVLNISKFNPLRAACNLIDIPLFLRNSRALDIRKYSGIDCFRRAVLWNESNETNYDFTAVSFPTELKDIPKFEIVNKVSIFIFALDEEDKLYPIAPSVKKFEKNIDLLLLSSGKHHHFVRITNFERLIRPQLTNRTNSIAICRRCFSYFDDQLHSKEEKLERHLEMCIDSPCRVVMPTDEEKILSFRNVKNQVRLPFCSYADTEAILFPLSTCEPSAVDQCSNAPRSYTHKLHKHEMMSYGIYVNSDIHDTEQDKDFNNIIIYTGKDSSVQFIKKLIEIAEKIAWYYSLNNAVIMTEEDRERHDTTALCYLCNEEFTPNNYKVIDHDHMTGKYRGPAHNQCNLSVKTVKYFPVLLHNLSAYDAHYLIKVMGKFPGEINVIANTEERFITFSKRVDTVYGHIWIRFLDSFRFLPSSLDNLVKTLSRDQFYILPKLFKGKKLELLMQKGHFPYEYVSDWSKLEETKLPPIECFYSSLTESTISKEDYDHAIKVWNEFDIKKLREYSELYLKTDVYLLAEVFENFRNEFFNSEYGLDPVHYITIPGLSFDGMLKITKSRIELIQDYDLLLFFEKGIRGGFTQVSHRHAVTDDSHQLIQLDATNLYGYSSIQILPKYDFKWEDPKNVDLLSISEDSDIGYVAEVDIYIPEYLHDYFNDFPPLTEQRKPPGSKYRKLIASLDEKINYIIHYRLLQFVVAHGCKLNKVHRVASFKQEAWLEPFIKINTEKRKAAKNPFAKDLYKLINNSNYGKTLQSVRKHMDLRIVDNWSKAEKLISKPNFQSRTIIAEDLVAIIMKKTSIKFNKPIFIGFTILEEAKRKMLQFHYDVMMKHYGVERLKLTYTDTDSFHYLLNTMEKDWRMEAFNYLAEYFDFSNLPKNHPCYSLINHGKLGTFKDEACGAVIKEFIGLRAKLYAIKIEGKEEVKKAKGIKKSAIRNKITFQDYKKTLLEGLQLSTKFNIIRSFNHRIFTVALNKLSLNALDDKRYINADNISTTAYGHYRLENIEDNEEEII